MSAPAESGAEEWVTLARLLRPQGRKGELLAESFTDFPEKLVGRPDLFLAPAEDAGAAAGAGRECQINAAWQPHGKNAGRLVLAIAGVDDIGAAERIAGWELRTPRAQRLALEEGETYLSDLIGCTVSNHGRELGVVSDVHFPTTPDGKRKLSDAPALLVVETPAGEVMIPFVSAYLRSVDTSAKQVVMALPEGLLEAQLAG